MFARFLVATSFHIEKKRSGNGVAFEFRDFEHHLRFLASQRSVLEEIPLFPDNDKKIDFNYDNPTLLFVLGRFMLMNLLVRISLLLKCKLQTRSRVDKT